MRSVLAALDAAVALLSYDDPGAAEAFEAAFFERHPKLRALKGRTYKVTVAGKARGTEVASFEFDRIVLKKEFFEQWAKHGIELADAIFAHELGHSVENELGLSELMKRAEALGIDPWDTSALPFGEFSVTEAFATTFAVLTVGSAEDKQRLQKQWPGWRALVAETAEAHRIRP